MFEELLIAAASRVAPNVTIESVDYDVQRFEYPPNLAEVDVILITGSASSSYDEEEWIHRLDNFVRDVYLNHHHIRIFGSCFGHQLVCQSLLGGHGLRVEQDPQGWELGVQEIEIEEKFRNTLRNGTKYLLGDSLKNIPETLRIQFVHADHVVIPSPGALPRTWMTVGSTRHCAVQGVYEPARVFTLQGHFEFDRFVNTEIMKVFGAKWDPKFLQETFDAINSDDDAQAAAEIVLLFMLEKASGRDVAACQVVGGLRTPPLE